MSTGGIARDGGGIPAHPLCRQVDVDERTHVENHAAIIYALVICHNLVGLSYAT